MHRYFLKYDDGPEQEVTKAEFVAEERRCGFRNTMGQPREPATAGFGAERYGVRIKGRVETDYQTLIEEMEARIALDKEE